jgi:hypothetical protein
MDLREHNAMETKENTVLDGEGRSLLWGDENYVEVLPMGTRRTSYRLNQEEFSW